MKKLNIFLQDINELEDSQNPEDLFEALRRCCQYQVAPPLWIRIRLEAGLERWHSFEVREFGDAFGIPARKGVHLEQRKKRREIGWRVFTFIYEGIQRGKRLDEMLHKAAEEFLISESTAKSLYYEALDILRDF